MKISIYFILLLSACTLFSCKKDTASTDKLRQAQDIVENKPSEALILLDSIPNAENMDKDSYMKYIVTSVHAQSKMKEDISGDTLIFEAQTYFNGKDNAKDAVLANYYAGIINFKMNRYDKSLTSFLKSSVYATKIGDNKLNGKISEYIGVIYFDQGIMDNAIINFQKALYYHNLQKDSISIMGSNNQLGRCYEGLNKLDSASIYFDRALQIAEGLNDEWSKSNITQNLGVTSFGMGKYDKAIEYYQSALSMESTDEDQKRRANLSLLKLYTIKQDLNSAKEYALKVEASLPEVTYIHTIKGMYGALTDYYKWTGDYKQALHFKELEAATKDEVANEEHPEEMIKAESNFRIEQKEKSFDEILSDYHIYLVLGIVLIIGMIVCFVLVRRQDKKDQEEVDAEIAKYNRARERLKEMNAHYPALEAEMAEMLKDIQQEKDKE